MASFKIYYKAADKDAKVLRAADTAPAGYTLLATVDHASTDTDVIYHHVRDALFAEGITNMQEISISVFDEIINVSAISVTPATAALAPLATQQLTVAFTPAAPDDTSVTYTSSATGVATVDVGGLVTAVADGAATITATSVDGSFTDTCVVTVTTV